MRCALAFLAFFFLFPLFGRADDEPDPEEIRRRLGEIDDQQKELDAERKRLLDILEKAKRTPGLETPDEPAVDEPAVDEPDLPEGPAEPPPMREGVTVLKEMVINAASRSPELPERVTLDYQAFTEEDIDRVQSPRVSDLLMEVPGLHVRSYGSVGRAQQPFLRGTAANQVVILLDGIPLNSNTGGFNMAGLGSSAIERVEVLRGSYGLQYGSEAMGGVISLESRRGRGAPGGFFLFEAGSFGTDREVLGIGGAEGSIDFAATLSRLRQKGDLDSNEYQSLEFLTRFGIQLSPDMRVDSTVSWSDREIEIAWNQGPQGGRPTVEPNGVYGTDRLTAGTNFVWDFAEGCEFRLMGAVQSMDAWQDDPGDGPTTFDPDGTPDSGDEFSRIVDEFVWSQNVDTWRVRAAVSAHLNEVFGWDYVEDGTTEISLTVGGEYLDESFRVSQVTPKRWVTTAPEVSHFFLEADRDIKSGFVAMELAFPDAGIFTGGVIDGGIRKDEYSDHDSVTSRFLGARITIDPTDTLIRSAFGEGFQAPSPISLHNPNWGNPDLEAQISESWDLGVHQNFFDGDLMLSATRFWMDVENNVIFMNGRMENLPGGSKHRGWEFLMRANLGSGFTIHGSYTKQKLINTITDLQYGREKFGSAGISWRDGPLLLALNGTFSGGLHDMDPWYSAPNEDAREHLGRRNVVDFTVRYRVCDDLELFGRIENLLNDEWVAGQASPAGLPIGAFAGFKANF